MDRETHSHHALARLAEQLPDDDAGGACAACRIGPADDDLDRRRNVTSGLAACDEGSKQERDMGGGHIPPDELSEALRHARGQAAAWTPQSNLKPAAERYSNVSSIVGIGGMKTTQTSRPRVSSTL